MTGLARRLGFVMWCALLASASPLAASALDDAIKPDRLTLDNGLQVWLKSRPGSGSVSILAAVKVGRRYETLQQRGLAHFVEHMIFEGTRHHSRKELERQLEARGEKVRAFTDEDCTWMQLDLPVAECEFGLKWMAENLFDSAFPAARIRVQRKILIREQQQEDDDELWWRLAHSVFGDNSALKGAADRDWERRNTERRFSRRDLLRFYKEQYVPNNMVLVIVGDFRLEDARSQVRRIFGPIARGPQPLSGARRPLVVADRPVRIAAPGGFDPCAVWCGYVVPRCSLEELYRLPWLMWLVASRTGDRVCAAEGLSYEVSYYPPWVTSQQAQADGQLFFVYADCSYADMPRVERIMRDELARVCTESISRREIATMRAAAATGWREMAQKNGWLASTLMSWALSGGAFLHLQQAMEAPNAAELKRVASRCFKPQRLFAAYYRPPKTPRELAAGGALMLALFIPLVISARRRNARLAPPPEHTEESLRTRYTPRFAAALLTRGLLFDIPAAFVIWWPALKLSQFFFSHAMFSFGFALFLVMCGIVVPVLVAVVASTRVKGVIVSRNGILLITSGFHFRLSPDAITSIRAGPINKRQLALHPRYLVLGGDTGQWVIVRTKAGFTICLGLRDAGQFVEQGRAYLGESVVPPPQPAGSSAGACRAQGNGRETCPPPAD